MASIRQSGPPELPPPGALRATRQWHRTDTVIAGVLLLYVVAAARTAISWDSHLYLASAKSLFWPGMERWYHWIREPLYPLQLRMSTALFGSADLGVILIQALIVVVATSVFVRVWFRHNPITRKIALVLIVANPIVIGMVGFVGQQAMILALVCLSAAWIKLVTDWTRHLRSGLIVLSGCLGACLALAAVALVPLAVANGAYVLLCARKRSDLSSSQDTTLTLISRRRAVMAALSLMLSAVLALSTWWAYKAIALQDAESAYGYPAWVWEYTGEDDPLSIPEKLLAFLALGRDGTIPPSAVAWELTVYGGLEEPFSNRCGFETAGDASASYSEGYLELSCRPAWATRINNRLAPLGLAVHRAALLGLFLATLIAVFVSRLRLFAVITVAFLLPYVVGGLGISRYAVPLYPLGVSVILMGVTAALNTVGKRQSANRQRDAERT